MLSLLFVLLNEVSKALMSLLKTGERLLQNWSRKELLEIFGELYI